MIFLRSVLARVCHGELSCRQNPEQPILPNVPIFPMLKGQKALVTGGDSGIGRAVAIALAHAGADVVVNYRKNADGAAEVVALAASTGSKTYAHQADVAKEEDVLGMFAKMIATFGTIDILVANAGLQQDSPFEKMSLAAVEHSDRRQPYGAVSLRPGRSGEGIQTPGRGCRKFRVRRARSSACHQCMK